MPPCVDENRGYAADPLHYGRQPTAIIFYWGIYLSCYFIFFRRLISEVSGPIVTKLFHMFDGEYSLWNSDKKLSCRRETARQLPTWMEGEGVGPPADSPSAPSGCTCAYGRIRKPQRTYVKVPSVKRTLRWIGHSRSFKVILIGAGRNPERCIVVMCN